MGWLFALLACYGGGERWRQPGCTKGDARLPYDSYEGRNVCQQHSNTSFFIVKLKFNPEDRIEALHLARARDYVYFRIGVLPAGLFLRDSVANRFTAIPFQRRELCMLRVVRLTNVSALLKPQYNEKG